jgi:hypothetical protein
MSESNVHNTSKSSSTSKKKKKSSKKRKAFAFAIKKLFKLLGTSVLLVSIFTSIIAAILFFSFRYVEKNSEYTVKLRTRPQTKAVSVKTGDMEIVTCGYFPVSALNGILGIRVVGDGKGITISNPSGTEVLEIVPDSNIIKVNGVWKKVENVVLYSKGECYLPMDLIDKYTCLTVSYDEKNTMYTISLEGAEDISFFPKNSGSDSPVVALDA